MGLYESLSTIEQDLVDVLSIDDPLTRLRTGHTVALRGMASLVWLSRLHPDKEEIGKTFLWYTSTMEDYWIDLTSDEWVELFDCSEWNEDYLPYFNIVFFGRETLVDMVRRLISPRIRQILEEKYSLMGGM